MRPAERLLISDRDGCNHDPVEVAEMLDVEGDRSGDARADTMHDAADVVRGLLALVRDRDAAVAAGERETKATLANARWMIEQQLAAHRAETARSTRAEEERDAAVARAERAETERSSVEDVLADAADALEEVASDLSRAARRQAERRSRDGRDEDDGGRDPETIRAETAETAEAERDCARHAERELRKQLGDKHDRVRHHEAMASGWKRLAKKRGDEVERWMTAWAHENRNSEMVRADLVALVERVRIAILAAVGDTRMVHRDEAVILACEQRIFRLDLDPLITLPLPAAGMKDHDG